MSTSAAYEMKNAAHRLAAAVPRSLVHMLRTRFAMRRPTVFPLAREVPTVEVLWYLIFQEMDGVKYQLAPNTCTA